MKKAITFALVLVLALSLAACGGTSSSGNGGGSTTTPPANNTTPGTSQPADNTTSGNADTSTVAGYLAQFGLTEDDIKAGGFTSFEGPDGWLIKVNADAGNADAWGKKIYDKIKSISEDGKVYDQGYPILTEDEASWVDNGTLYQWAYRYNGKVVEIDVFPPIDTPTQYRVSIHFQ